MAESEVVRLATTQVLAEFAWSVSLRPRHPACCEFDVILSSNTKDELRRIMVIADFDGSFRAGTRPFVEFAYGMDWSKNADRGGY